MKNVVFIPNIDLGDNRNEPYKYSIKSWKHFCDKYDCELLVLEDLLVPVESMKVTWQRFYLFDILEQNEIDYDQILLVDADTIVHPDCPNFFELTNHEYSAVVNNGSFEWVKRSVEAYSQLMFDNEIPFDLWNYINCGFQIVNKKHKPFFEFVTQYYHDNQKLIQDSIRKVQAGTDQTIINFLLRQQDIKINYLPVCYNLQDLNSKQLLFLDERMWFGDDIIFKDCGWVYHFNAIPPNPMDRDAKYWIKRTYTDLYVSKESPLDLLLDVQKDKSTYHNTTSKKFKKDLISFFGDDYKDKNIYEVGADAGLTSRVFSFLFKSVIVNNNWNPNNYDKNNDWIVKDKIDTQKDWYNLYSVNLRNEIKHDFDNIQYLEMDSYDVKGWPTDIVKDISVVMIDCVHTFQAVNIDIENALKLNPDYIIFDDYGLSTMAEVKQAVDNHDKIEIVKRIGLEPGEYEAKDRPKPMKFVDSEGVICKVK
jgi:hypothetical protein